MKKQTKDASLEFIQIHYGVRGGGANLFVHTHKKGGLLALHVIGMDLVNQSI